MPKLRQAVIKRIQTSLNASPFSAEDFLVTLPSEGDVLAQIAFLPDPGYALAITGPSAGAYTTKEVPGAYYNESEYSHRNLDIALNRITPWAENIYEELQASNVFLDELQEIRAQLEEQILSHVTDADQHFTPDEMNDLRAKLDQLGEQFDSLQQRYHVTEDELAQVKEELSAIKANVETFPKGVWYRTAANKVLNLIKRVVGSQEAKQMAITAARQLFLPGPPDGA